MRQKVVSTASGYISDLDQQRCPGNGAILWFMGHGLVFVLALMCRHGTEACPASVIGLVLRIEGRRLGATQAVCLMSKWAADVCQATKLRTRTCHDISMQAL